MRNFRRRSARLAATAAAAIAATAALIGGVVLAAAPAQALVGGTAVPAGSRSYFAEVSSPLGRCGGAMVSPEWVLTASHCVWTPGAAAPVGDTSVTVTAGWTGGGGAPISLRSTDIVFHPLRTVDMALIHVPRTPGVTSVALTDVPLEVGDTYVSVGAGEGSNGRLTESRFTVGWASPYYEFTAKGAPGVVNCYGDSGSPAIVETPHGDRLAGVTWGITPNDCSANPTTHVDNVWNTTTREWITSTVGSAATEPTGSAALPPSATHAISRGDGVVAVTPAIECPASSDCRVASNGAAGSVRLTLFAVNTARAHLSYPAGDVQKLGFSVYDAGGRELSSVPSFTCRWSPWADGDFLECLNTTPTWIAIIPAGGRLAPSAGGSITATLDVGQTGIWSVGHDFSDAAHPQTTVWDMQIVR